MNLSVPVRPE